MTDSKWKSTSRSPLQLLLIAAFSIFIAETLVMLLFMLPLPFLQSLSGWAEALLDSTLLVVLLFPALYFFMFRPYGAPRRRTRSGPGGAEGKALPRPRQG